MKYAPIIGLETHVELATNSKMFCTCSALWFSETPNTHTCPTCLGMPGGLPVPNKIALEGCIKIALALNCEINLFSKFDRKNYFYPDLPKGYQISQYDLPFGKNGHITLKNGHTIGITRVHMEEDTGKLIHSSIDQDKVSLIDFNRSGVPLVEIVTEPDFHSSENVIEYLQRLQQTVRYIKVSTADMEKGQMRLEPNISLATEEQIRNSELPKYKVEVKNINSFAFVRKAIEYEIKRQSEILNKGETPAQETRGWNEKYNRTDSQRSKEEAHDYRYFPEPDIPPFNFTNSEINALRQELPELPVKKAERFIKEYNLTPYDAEILTREVELADYFEQAVSLAQKEDISPKQLANYIINKKIDINSTDITLLVQQTKQSNQTVVVDEDKLNKVIDDIIKNNKKAVSDYKNGKEIVIMYLVGQVMKEIKQKIDTQMLKEKLKNKLTT